MYAVWQKMGKNIKIMSANNHIVGPVNYSAKIIHMAVSHIAQFKTGGLAALAAVTVYDNFLFSVGQDCFAV